MGIRLLVPSHLASTQKRISIVTFPDAILSSFSLVPELTSAMDMHRSASMAPRGLFLLLLLTLAGPCAALIR
ncbi:hypothetical protein AAES_71223 [Amazona aestiva]|uniref:Uncharacterized protein n=1 Tax=Amazona aestiva TaxID=12930 RepID=A0A0Q3Q2L2_AMAAE|nr:hypothetical protein AAES_71223 [Amazona aestiva]